MPHDIPVAEHPDTASTVKRKASNAVISKKDSKTQHPQTATHSHPHQSSDEDDSQDGAAKDKKQGKAQGNSDKRKEQNRVAQRNFRNRKENQLKDLEDRLGSLEEIARSNSHENSVLKDLVKRLQQENERLLAQSASTKQPLIQDKTGLINSQFTFEPAKDVSNFTSLSADALKGLAGITGVDPSAMSQSLPKSFNFTSYGQQPVPSGYVGLSNSSSTRPVVSRPSRKSSTPSTGAADSPQESTSSSHNRSCPSVMTDHSSHSSTAGDGIPPITPPAPLSTTDFDYLLTGNNAFGSQKDLATPIDFSSDLFSDWRDTTALPNNDNIVGLDTYRNFNSADMSIYPNFDQGIDYDALFRSASDALSPAPLSAPTLPQSFTSEEGAKATEYVQQLIALKDKDPANFDKFYGFMAKRWQVEESERTKTVADLQSEAFGCPLINSMDPSFDLDLLCSEMKAKATCQEAAKYAYMAAQKADEEFAP